MNQAIYQQIYKILHEKFSRDERVRVLDEEAIFAEIVKELNGLNPLEFKEEIRQAIIHFFASKGFKAFVFFGNNGKPIIKRKLFDYENNIYVNLFVTAFLDLKHEIKDDNNSGTLVIEKELLDRFYDFLADIENIEERKNIIKSAIKKIFDLKERDAIFISNNKIIIKLFCPTNISTEKKPQVYRRSYEHLPEETLKYILRELEKNGLDEKIKQMVLEATQNELNFTKINNFQFGKSFIKVFQDKLYVLISATINEENKDNLIAYTNYVLRQKFDKILFLLAKELVDLLLVKNVNAETFLRFYNGDVAFTPDNKRFQKPDIIDETGLRWNSSTIFHVAIQRKKGLEKIKEITEEIASVEAKIADFEKKIIETKAEIVRAKEKLVLVEKEFRLITQKTKELVEDIKNLKNELAQEKDPERIRQLQELISKKSLEHKKQVKEEELNVLEKKKVENDIEKLEIKELTLNKDKVAFERKLQADIAKKSALIENQKPLDEKYETVIKAVAKAISSFRGVTDG